MTMLARAALLLALLLCARPASADNSAPQGAQAPILVLGVLFENQEDSALTAAMVEHLGRIGERVVKRPRLSTSERRCSDQPCLEKLVQRFSTPLILGGRLEAQQEGGREFRVFLFDASTRQTRESSDRCLECSEERLGLVVRGVTGRVIHHYRTPEEATPPPRPADPRPAEPEARSPEPVRPGGPAPTMPLANDLDESRSGAGAAAVIGKPEAAAQRPQRGLPTWRRNLGIGLGVTAVATLVTSIALTGRDGSPSAGPCNYKGMSDFYPDCVYNFTPLYGTGYALTGVLAVGAVISFWPALSPGARAKEGN